MYTTPSTPPVKAQTKHIVLFVIACVLLVGILTLLFLPTGMSAPDVPDEPADPYVLVGGAVYLIGSYLLVGLAVFVGVAVAWITGLVISLKLARRRADKPKWLWVASLGLVVAFGLIAVGLLAAWILV